MSNHKAIIDPWVQYARGWLKKKEEANLRRSTQNLVQKMNEKCMHHEDYDDAWKCIEDLVQLLDRFHDDGTTHSKEAPQIFVDCGIAAYHMGNARQAITYINTAIAKYTDQHDKAVAHWMLGCMRWSLDNPMEAIAEWETSLNQFEEQSMKMQRNVDLVKWYNEIIELMREVVAEGAENNLPPKFRTSAASTPVSSVKSAAPKRKHTLRSVPVIGEIPAGAPLGILPAPSDYLASQVFKFENNSTEYRMLSLTSGQLVIRLNHRYEYYILHVRGTSMNDAKPEKIEDGDYVLMRKQNTAEPNDIVAAEITSSDGKDDRATLKRFKVVDGKIQLIPESSDPQYKKPMFVDRMFTDFDVDFHIRGIALAVFKKL